MESHRIALISDTHGMLRQEVEEIVRTCEAILHAGDIGKPEILLRLKVIADTYAVRGNVDGRRIDEFPDELPEELDVELFGFHIYMVHDQKHIRKDLKGADIVAFGHSHTLTDEVRPPSRGMNCGMPSGYTLTDEVRPPSRGMNCGMPFGYSLTDEENDGQIRFLNPGSCGPKRFRLPVTMMVLTLYPAAHRLEVEKIDFTSPAFAKEEPVKVPEKDRYRLIQEIMMEIDAGKSISEIAARHQIDEKFTEQVCRMYLTHPGVDVDGIMDRIERRNL